MPYNELELYDDQYLSMLYRLEAVCAEAVENAKDAAEIERWRAVAQAAADLAWHEGSDSQYEIATPDVALQKGD